METKDCGCAQRRAMLAKAGQQAKAGNYRKAAKSVAAVAVHVVKHPPIQRGFKMGSIK